MWEPSPRQFSSKLIPTSSHLDLQRSPHTQIIRLYVQVGVQVSFFKCSNNFLTLVWGGKMASYFFGNDRNLSFAVHCCWMYNLLESLTPGIEAFCLRQAGWLYTWSIYMMPSFVLKVIFWLDLGKVLFGTGLLALMVMPHSLLMQIVAVTNWAVC